MFSEQKYFPAKRTSNSINPQSILSKIEIENAKIKMLVSLYRDRTSKEEDLLGNDSDYSKHEALSQNRIVYRQNSKNKLRRHNLFDNDKLAIKKQYFGDEGIHQKKTHNNFFKQNFQISKFYEKLNPLKKDTNLRQTSLLNPEHMNQGKEFGGIKSQKLIEPKNKMSAFRVKSKIDDLSLKKQLHPKSLSKPKKKVEFREEENAEIELVDAHILASHLNSLEFLQPTSSPAAIFSFFESIYQILRIKKVSEPVIKRYKNCIYYGQKMIQYNTLYQGMIWYYKQSFYFGELSQSKKHGKGIQIRYEESQPCIWKGKFVNGHKNGYFQVQTTQYKYYGNLKDGLFDGQGHLITSNSQYKGNFCEGIKEGRGWQKFTNKSEYKGQYFNNKYDGEGELKAPNYYYKGFFKNGKPDGYGFERSSQFQYLGTFSMGKKQGKGRLKTNDGTYIQCQFKNGLIDEEKNQEVQSPKQRAMDHYMSRDLQALNEKNEEGTLENMLNEINDNSDIRILPLQQS